MEKVDVSKTIDKFIDKMGYLNNEHVLGCFFYGSYLTGYNNSHSDIDLHIIFDNNDPDRLYRGNEYVDGIRIEYFEKPIEDIYESVDNDFENQSNALLAIIGKGKIIFDKTGDLKKLQDYTLDKYSKPLPKLDSETAKEYVSIINNRMDKLAQACENNSLNFTNQYHLTLEKIRKFYHRLNGVAAISTSKVYRAYLDRDYAESFNKGVLPDETFIGMYLDAVQDNTSSIEDRYNKINELWKYVKRSVKLDESSYRILIKSRNKMPKPNISD
jgi:predicted nucleotidyltransferase